jgi:CheY-like chemotaxis protein
LVQMIANLLSNAARHSGRNLDIDLSVVASVQLVEIHVRDRGAGIAPELLPRIFDLFAQSEQSVARSEGGLGIGLALVRRIAELHGGHAEAHSDGIDRGAHFVVVLPRLAEVKNAEPVRLQAVANAAPRQLRILVVDDNQDAANMISMLLELEGHETFVTYDARTAITRAEIERPDVMLLDIGLPDMSGYELAQRLRALPASAEATFIALTGYGQASDQRRSKEAGFDHHLTKPVSADVLRNILAESRN